MLVLLAAVFGCALLSDVASSSQVTYQEYLLYDFYSKLPVNKVKAHFNGVSVVKKHKAVGVGRYFFLVKDDHSAALNKLTLPADAYNERVFPVEHVFALFSHFRKAPSQIDLPSLPDGNLTFAERTWHRNLDYSTLQASMASYADSVVAMHSSVVMPVHVFVPSGQLPLKFFFFLSMPDYNMTDLFLHHSQVFGGPGSLEISTVNIVNID